MKFRTERESKWSSFDFSCHTFSPDSFKTSCLSLRESVFRLEEPGIDRGLAIFHSNKRREDNWYEDDEIKATKLKRSDGTSQVVCLLAPSPFHTANAKWARPGQIQNIFVGHAFREVFIQLVVNFENVSAFQTCWHVPDTSSNVF